jgi:hypothetical protein
MDVVVYAKGLFAAMRRLRDAALRNTTDEQLNWIPPGIANPIRASLVHLLTSEDRVIHVVLQGKPMVWESGDWGEQIGLAAHPGYGPGWDDAKSTTLRLAPLLDYAAAVGAAADEYIARLTPEELERTVPYLGDERPVRDVLAMMVVHASAHAGEIAALKGIQGVKGLPF